MYQDATLQEIREEILQEMQKQLEEIIQKNAVEINTLREDNQRMWRWSGEASRCIETLPKQQTKKEADNTMTNQTFDGV